MPRIIRTFVIALVGAAMLIGSSFAPAKSANLLCPQICGLEGILAGLNLSSSSVSAASESRDYQFTWIALDLSEQLPALVTTDLNISVDGTTSDGVFTGQGVAYFGDVYLDVELTDVGGAITVTDTEGDDETLVITILDVGGGVGHATYLSHHDFDPTAACTEC